MSDLEEDPVIQAGNQGTHIKESRMSVPKIKAIYNPRVILILQKSEQPVQ